MANIGSTSRDGSFVSTGACNLELSGSNQIRVGPDIWHGVHSAAYGTVHYKEPLKSFKIRVGHSPGFGLPSVAILSQCAESDVKQDSLTQRLVLAGTAVAVILL